MIRQLTFSEIGFILQSTGWTIFLTLASMIVGGALGAVIAIARVSLNPLLRWTALVYIQVIQGIPVLMVLFLSYYGLPLFGIRPPPLLAAVLSMSIYVSAYLGEIWRGALQSVPYQQWEASTALALTRPQQFRYIIVPQAVRIALAPTIGFVVQLVKNTSVASIIGFVELARAGQLVNSATFQPFKVFGIVALIYFLICYPLSQLSRHLERTLHAGRAG